MSLSDFACQIRKLGKLAYPDLPQNAKQGLMMDQFVKGVGSRDLSVTLCTMQISDLNAALSLAQRLEGANAITQSISVPTAI